MIKSCHRRVNGPNKDRTGATLHIYLTHTSYTYAQYLPRCWTTSKQNYINRPLQNTDQAPTCTIMRSGRLREAPQRSNDVIMRAKENYLSWDDVMAPDDDDSDDNYMVSVVVIVILVRSATSFNAIHLSAFHRHNRRSRKGSGVRFSGIREILHFPSSSLSALSLLSSTTTTSLLCLVKSR